MKRLEARADSAREPRGVGSGKGGRHLDIAVDGLGVRADRVRGIDQGLRLLALDAGYTDLKTRAEKKRTFRLVQIDFGVDRQTRRKLDLPLHRGEFDRTHVAG